MNDLFPPKPRFKKGDEALAVPFLDNGRIKILDNGTYYNGEWTYLSDFWLGVSFKESELIGPARENKKYV